MRLEDYFRPRISEAGYGLFAVFSRFEYAMKKGGFRREKYPDAAWHSFANSLSQNFFQKMQEAEEARVYFEEPPDHLVLSGDNDVDWSNAPHFPTDAASLFQSIKQARNNLFHGDKKHDNDHDNRLMEAGLFILNEAYKDAEQNKDFTRFLSAMEYAL